MFVKPREGLRVLDPIHKRPLPPEGANVPDDRYWRRHIARGDAVEVKDTDPPQERTASPEHQAEE